MRRLIFLLIFMATCTSAQAAEIPAPKFEWGMSQAAVLAEEKRTPDHRDDEQFHFESYDLYPGRIVETDYRFNQAGQLAVVSFRMRPHWEDGATLEQMLEDYRRLLELYLIPTTESYGNEVVVTHGDKKIRTYPDNPPRPTAADIESGVRYTFESRASSEATAVFCYISVSEEGQASLSVSLHSEQYK